MTSDDRIDELIFEPSEQKDKSARLGEHMKKELWRTKEGRTRASTGHSKACHGTAVLMQKRWSKHIKVVRHSDQYGIWRRTRTTIILWAPKPHRQMQQDKHTPTGWRRLQRPSRSDGRARRASDSAFGTQNDRGRFAHWTVQHQLVPRQYTTQQNKASHPTTRLRVLKHCEDAETKGQIDMNTDHTAMMARMELSLDHKTVGPPVKKVFFCVWNRISCRKTSVKRGNT